MEFRADPEFALLLDQNDELARFRQEFVIEDPDLIYLDGNSLGRLPKRTGPFLERAVTQGWGERLIRVWNDGWIDAPLEVGAKLARLIGAESEEVIVAESTSVNLFKLAAAALVARPGRAKIVSDELNFPSDLYVLQGLIRLLGEGHRLALVPSGDTVTVREEDLAMAIDEETALVCLSQVSFTSAFLNDMKRVTDLAHRAGALILWDLSHSAGVVHVDLAAAGADLAVGCTYKYLNGGPGAPAFLYVRRDLQKELLPPIWGWFASERPFAFEREFKPAEDMRRFWVSTPPMLSLKALEPALDVVLEAGIEQLRAKSEQQTAYLIFLADAWLVSLGFTLGSPRTAEIRGSHVALRHPEGYRINRALIEPTTTELRVIPDFREPDNIRLGLAPLYTTYTEIHRAASRLRQVVEEREYEKYPSERAAVT